MTKRLMLVVLLSLGLIACGTQEEPKRNLKEEFPIVMVDFLRWKDVDAEGDQKFFVYRCKYCFGIKDGLAKQQELLSKNRSDMIFTLRSSKIGKKEKEELFEDLIQAQIDTARLVGKMEEARRKFLEDEVE